MSASQHTTGGTTVDYEYLLKTYPWIVEKNQDCVLSPDSDGLLCGLLMSHYLGWRVRGFYDGKALLLENGFKPSDCVFLDMEIFRENVRSIGQHMIHFNLRRPSTHWGALKNCISANGVREFDYKTRFSEKYPLATVHFLMALISQRVSVAVPESGICPLLYTDGTFKNLFNYPDNCLSWFYFLVAEKASSPLHSVFFNNNYSITDLMLALKEFFEELRIIAHGKRGADKIKFTDTKGHLVHFDKKEGTFDSHTIEQAQAFIKVLAAKTDWKYKIEQWSWKNLVPYIFEKRSRVPSQGRYDEIMEEEPVSLAITGSLSIEYTIDPRGFLK